jgi:acylphosphatase
MKRRRVRVRISGRVQRVFFRAYTHEAAQLIEVAGWVRNMRDGRVEAVFEGTEENVKKMIEWCYRGSPLSRVDSVEVVEEVFTGEFVEFDITH